MLILEHMNAADAAAILTDLTTHAGLTTKPKVSSDARTNSLLVQASPEDMRGVRKLIAQLDVKVPEDLFPPASADMVIPFSQQEEGGWSMMDLVLEYSRLTNQKVQFDRETSNLLFADRVNLSSSVVVPKLEVQSFFENLLVQYSYILQLVRTEEPRLLAIRSLNTGARSGLRSTVQFVPEADLDRWVKHPSMLITTATHMPNTDVRQLSNSMRTMITDANTQQMLPAGNTNTMILTGLAPQVVRMVRMLRFTDEAARMVASEAPTFERYPLEHAVAAEIASSVEELVGFRREIPGRATPQPMPGPRPASVRVMADPRTNALVVAALASDLERVRRVVELFDVEKE